jgi:hypothetical protein
VSASIRIKIIGGTDIDDAYYDCESVSIALGGMSVETVFNGVNMFYYHQPVKVWEDEYCKEKFGKAKKGDEL